MSQNTFAFLSLIWAEVRQVAYTPYIHRKLTRHCVIKSWVSKTDKHKWKHSLRNKEVMVGHTAWFKKKPFSGSFPYVQRFSWFSLSFDDIIGWRYWNLCKLLDYLFWWFFMKCLPSLAPEGLWRIPLSTQSWYYHLLNCDNVPIRHQEILSNLQLQQLA